MPQHVNKGRRYSGKEKAAAVRMVRTLRDELGTSQRTTVRVAKHLGYGVESVCAWVCHADIDDGVRVGSRPTFKHACGNLSSRIGISNGPMKS